ncbi:MAG TPA: ectonucleotide pyrophosphatase/phosphodiesterase [Tepidisphaeraceae bacterium]|jgi:arylsulfatase A-like enzyme|nr:ectonucleotide pyrophosphatase/phosphodiesterase [Tepidisphaeraceae bacterium]
MKFRCLAFAVIILISCDVHAASPDRPEPQIKRVLIISIDGLRPDVLLRAQTPHLHAMMDHGSFTMWARTTAQSITLPSHVSMLTGVTPEVHGILWNSELPLERPVYPNAPTLFELARRAGYTTAIAAGKNKFSVFDKPAARNEPAALSWKYITTSDKTDDAEVTRNALEILREHQPEVMFVHLPQCDNVGHSTGWGTPEQLATVSHADDCIGQLETALDELRLSDSTMILVTADHGGAGRTHGPEDPRSRTIPWIVTGPGIRKNFDLTRLGKEYDITTFDTFATACYVLGIPLNRRIDGKPIQQIFINHEMLAGTSDPSMAPATMPSN